MRQTELHEKFIYALAGRFNKRSTLVAQVSDILKIERDSANRRLSGKVQFSIREMGILARTLGISVDSLIYDDIPSCSELLIMENPGVPVLSAQKATEELTSYIHLWKKISEQSYSESGNVISSLPIHLLIHYPLLLRFVYFKWAHYIHSFKETFGAYQIPLSMRAQIELLKESLKRINYTFYIWDHSFVLGIINDIRYFRNMGLLEQEELEGLQTELSGMLYKLESVLVADKDECAVPQSKVEHYVSSVDLEVSASYVWSEQYHHSFIFTFFMHSATFSDQSKCIKIRNWINSMKKVSTLISGSGEMSRTKFLKNQRFYIDSL